MTSWPEGDLAAHTAYRRLWRMSAVCYRRGWARPARALELAFRWRWSADVPPGLALTDDVVLMHNALGDVIHVDTHFEGSAVVYQHVTLGRANRPGTDGAPTIGDGVIIGAGAAVLGPVRVGTGCVVGANAVVTRDVPHGCIVTAARPTPHAFHQTL